MASQASKVVISYHRPDRAGAFDSPPDHQKWPRARFNRNRFLYLIVNPEEKGLRLLDDLTAIDAGGDLACVFGRMDDFSFLSFALSSKCGGSSGETVFSVVI